MLPIAVIIANRNNARYLAQCVESVLHQSLRPNEIVVADDASTDDSLDVLAPFVRDGAITLVQNTVQRGVAAARHLAICSSTSRYITTLDSDDFYAGKDKLAAEADTLGSNQAEGRIAFSDVLRVDRSGETLGLVSTTRRIREGNLSFHIPHLSGFIPRDYLVSRENYFEAGGFDTALRIYEDWDLKIRLSLRCTWHFSGVTGTAYRNNPKGLSGAQFTEHVRTMRSIFRKYSSSGGPLSRTAAAARFFVYHSLYLKRPAF
jgi:glycosyltransferase involved in cell wall biosynthesis